LAGEAPVGVFPYRGMLACWLLECLALIAVIVLPDRITSLQPYQPPPTPKWEVLYYYSGDELPQTQDTGGAQAGKSGRAGGQQAYHRTQTLRVARGDRPSEKVVDAPKLDLPHSDSSVANLLAFQPLPGPPPTEGLRASLIAPRLPNPVVPPVPDLNSAPSRKQDGLTVGAVPPAPEMSHPNARTTPPLSASVVAPAPDIMRDKLRSGDSINPSVIAPPPREAPRDLASSRAPLTPASDVVAPPVSAPAREMSATSKFSLPAPIVVAPPPSQVSRDLNSWGSTASGDLRTNPVPPAPSVLGAGSIARGGVGGLGQQVVPPPAGGLEQGWGGRNAGRLGGSRLGSADAVPPAPSLGGGKALSGSGRGTKGTGVGGPLDLGSAVAPPSRGGGAASGSGVVVSNQPGIKVGLPNSSGRGAIAMSPGSVAKTGLGGSSGGAGIGKGNGPGSGMQGEGSGAGKQGMGQGSDPSARGGISPYPGSGGTGSGANGTPPVPGVSVQGGTTQILTLPSFGTDADGSRSAPGRSSTEGNAASPVTVKGTSSSGGGFRRYGELKGDNYSIYIETSLGIVVMQFADAASVAHPYAEDLTPPEPIRKDLPEGLRRTRVVFACIVDRSGVLKDIRILEPGAAETTSSILVALQNWKFRPAFHGYAPVEVNAILGFGVDTR
jgi:hypothetical protein